MSFLDVDHLNKSPFVLPLHPSVFYSFRHYRCMTLFLLNPNVRLMSIGCWTLGLLVGWMSSFHFPIRVLVLFLYGSMISRYTTSVFVQLMWDYWQYKNYGKLPWIVYKMPWRNNGFNPLLTSHYWKCNYRSVCRSVGCLVGGRSVIIS